MKAVGEYMRDTGMSEADEALYKAQDHVKAALINLNKIIVSECEQHHKYDKIKLRRAIRYMLIVDELLDKTDNETI